MIQKKKIVLLVIDDDPSEYIHMSIKRGIPPSVKILSALDQESAQMFLSHQIPDIIIMDACVPGNQPNTGPLIKEIRNAGFNGTMIGSSSQYLKYLEDEGCDIVCQKNDIIRTLRNVLNTMIKE